MMIAIEPEKDSFNASFNSITGLDRDTPTNAVPNAALKSVREAHGKIAAHDITCADTLTLKDLE